MKDNKITINELRQSIVEKSNQNKKIVSSFLDSLFPLIEDGLRTDGIVKINGFGTFKLQWNEPRKSVDVNTGAEIQIEGYNKIVFVPETFLKQKINEPFAHLEAVALDQKGVTDTEKQKEDIPMQKLDEQAEEIKDLLADINDIQETEQPAQVETETNTKNTMKKQTAKLPDAAPKQETAPTKSTVIVQQEKPKAEPAKETPKKVTIPQPIKKPKKNSWKIVGIILGAFIVILIVLYFVLQNKIEQWVNKQMEPQPIEEVVKEEVQPLSIFEQPRTYTEFIATEKLTDGSRLAWLSKKYYGAPYFWVYIYEANKELIPDPNHIMMGTKINVPKLPAELIDQNNPEALEYARKLHDQYVK